jgi:hypothetical protein
MADDTKINTEEARKAEEANRKAAAKSHDEALAESRKAADADTKAYYERVASSQPTPTQAENDRAKLGIDSLEQLDSKEDDGSGSEAEVRAAAAKAEAERLEAEAKAAAKK